MSSMDAFFQRPKAELHIHLEGSLRMDTAMFLAHQQPTHPWHGQAREPLEKRLRTGGFPEFIECFMEGYRLLSSAAHFQQVTEELCADLERQGVVAAQVLYSPGVYTQKLGVPLQAIHGGITAGLARFPQLDMVFIVDTVLNLGFEFMDRTLSSVLADRPEFLGGFSVGGGDPQLDMHTFLPLFDKASRHGLFCVAHAGEVDGPANIRCLLEHSDVCRIAHGCAAANDPTLLKDLRRRGIAIDVCPTSNLRTGAVSSLAEHPLHTFLAHGLTVTLNSDDPFYFQTDLMREYRLAITEMGLTQDQVHTIMDDSLRLAGASS